MAVLNIKPTLNTKQQVKQLRKKEKKKHRNRVLSASDYDSQTVVKSEKILKSLYNRHLQLILSLDFPNVGCVPFRQAHSVSILFLPSMNHKY